MPEDRPPLWPIDSRLSKVRVQLEGVRKFVRESDGERALISKLTATIEVLEELRNPITEAVAEEIMLTVISDEIERTFEREKDNMKADSGLEPSHVADEPEGSQFMKYIKNVLIHYNDTERARAIKQNQFPRTPLSPKEIVDVILKVWPRLFDLIQLALLYACSALISNKWGGEDKLEAIFLSTRK